VSYPDILGNVQGSLVQYLTNSGMNFWFLFRSRFVSLCLDGDAEFKDAADCDGWLLGIFGHRKSSSPFADTFTCSRFSA